jgi:hypothetical protein
MTVQQAFGVAVRSIGVFWLGYGITTIGFCFFTSQSSALNSAFGGGAALIVGVLLMLKADRVVKLCYTTYDEFGYPVDEAEKPSG